MCSTKDLEHPEFSQTLNLMNNYNGEFACFLYFILNNRKQTDNEKIIKTIFEL